MLLNHFFGKCTCHEVGINKWGCPSWLVFMFSFSFNSQDIIGKCVTHIVFSVIENLLEFLTYCCIRSWWVFTVERLILVLDDRTLSSNEIVLWNLLQIAVKIPIPSFFCKSFKMSWLNLLSSRLFKATNVKFFCRPLLENLWAEALAGAYPVLHLL